MTGIHKRIASNIQLNFKETKMMSNMIKSKSHVAGSMGSKVRDKSGSVKVSG